MEKNKNIKIVKASAGTGKTYRLALEYISQLLLGEDYSEILFITFTRGATAELKERIFEFLDNLSYGDLELERNIKDLYEEIEIDKGEVRKIKNRLLQNKDKIRIYTIDSFIGQIFKKAIGPFLNIYSYSMANATEAEEVYKEVFSKIINSDNFFKIKKFLEKTADRDVEKYIELIKKISEDRWKFSLIGEKEEEIDVEELKGDLYRTIMELFLVLKELGEEPKKEFEKILAKGSKELYNKFQGKLLGEELLKEPELIGYILGKKEFFKKEKYYNGVQTKGKFISYKERLENLQNRVRSLIDEIVFVEEILPYEKDILEIEKITRILYDEIKFREKKLTFSDITNYTSEYLEKPELDLLKNDKEVSDNFYEIIGGKIKILFLDEAQDTSVSQWKVIEPIVKRCKNVVIVGDEKQSIYSWRGGNKGLFLNFAKILGGETENLPMNFRSEKKVIDFVNVFFESVSQNYHNEKNHEKSENWEYKSVQCSKKTNEGYVGVMVEREIHKEIAKDIRSRFLEADGSYNYNGIGIVARRRKELNIIGEELKKLGIPYVMVNSFSIIEHSCIKEVLSLLNFFIHNDFMMLLEFMRKTLNLGEEDLKYVLKNKDKVKKYFEIDKEVNSNEVEEIKIRYCIIEELEKIKNIRGSSYKTLGKKIINEYSLMDKYSSPRDIKNINYFLELMEETRDLGSFLRFLDENKEDLKQLGMEELNSVVLMTIHGSKGLDFHTEYMFLNDKEKRFSLLNYSEKGTTHNVQLLTKLDENYRYIEDYLLTNSVYSPYIKEKNIYEYMEEVYNDEEMNAIYVGMTRPRANLIVCIKPTKTTKNKEDIDVLKNDLIISPIEKYFETSREELLEGGFRFKGEFIPYKDKEDSRDIGGEKFVLSTKKYREVIEENFEEHLVKDIEKTKEEVVERGSYNIENELKRKSGLAIHYYLENIKYGGKEERDLAKQLTMNKYANMLGSERIEEVIKRVEKFIETEKEVFDERWEVFRELEVVIFEKDKKSRKSHIIDRLNLDRKNKVIIIYDYKSGETMEKEQLERYKEVIRKKVGDSYKIKASFLNLSKV